MKKIIISNFKMNTVPTEMKAYSMALATKTADSKNQIIVCPPYTHFAIARQFLDGSKILLGAQNVAEAEKGAYTGEISIPMLKDIGIDWCIIGHSERRTYDNETSEKCNKKILALLANGITPVYCCGESLETFEANKTKEFVEEQIVTGFKDVSYDDAAKVVIAYEPIWAIGTGKNASKEIAEDICCFIRNVIAKLYDRKVANKVRILYGGSVKPATVKEYLTQKDIDGALVGGASLDVNSYKELLTSLL